jgi:hypothetical protein
MDLWRALDLITTSRLGSGSFVATLRWRDVLIEPKAVYLLGHKTRDHIPRVIESRDLREALETLFNLSGHNLDAPVLIVPRTIARRFVRLGNQGIPIPDAVVVAAAGLYMWLERRKHPSALTAAWRAIVYLLGGAGSVHTVQLLNDWHTESAEQAAYEANRSKVKVRVAKHRAKKVQARIEALPPRTMPEAPFKLPPLPDNSRELAQAAARRVGAAVGGKDTVDAFDGDKIKLPPLPKNSQELAHAAARRLGADVGGKDVVDAFDGEVLPPHLFGAMPRAALPSPAQPRRAPADPVVQAASAEAAPVVKKPRTGPLPIPTKVVGDPLPVDYMGKLFRRNAQRSAFYFSATEGVYLQVEAGGAHHKLAPDAVNELCAILSVPRTSLLAWVQRDLDAPLFERMP